MSKNKQKTGIVPRDLRQVSSKSLIPPTEPDEVIEADVDFSKEEKDIAAQMKALKARAATLSKRKKQAVGGKKLVKMRKYAEETTDWATKSAAKFIVSTRRANDAVANLAAYEETLGIIDAKRTSNKLIDKLGVLTDPAESIGKGWVGLVTL